MADVAEVTDEPVTHEHVVRRVEDWVARLNKLYSLVESWLPDGWRVASRPSVNMDEEMMRRFQVPARSIPALQLVSDDDRTASLEPRALWVIGANGRADLYCGNKHFIVVDRSERFEPPNWQISDFNDRREIVKLDEKKLTEILAA